MVSKNAHIISAYRSLYRSSLHAVQYSKPARYIMRDALNIAFRGSPPSEFDAKRIGNTILFLENAAKAKGLEHRVLKNIMHVRWWQHSTRRSSEARSHTRQIALLEKGAIQQFELTLQMLNESMNLCLT